MTSAIYHADDRTMRHGVIKFKPLTMETVVENEAENKGSRKKNQQGIRDIDYKKNFSAEYLH